jgi:hypothetical protein
MSIKMKKDIDFKFPRSQINYNIPNFKKLFEKIKFAITKLNYNINVSTISNIKININDIKTGVFLTQEIANIIINNMKHIHIISITYNDIKFDVCVYTDERIKKLKSKFVKSLVIRILLFNILTKKYYNSNKARIPKIILYMLNLPKQINFLKEMKNPLSFIFNSQIINSGYHDVNNGEIVIFRSEEILKVIIHELIHFYELDYFFSNYSLPINIINNILTHYNLSSDNNYIWNECKTESLAILLYYMIEVPNLEKLNKCIKLELDWNMFQIAKIIFLITKDINTHTILQENSLSSSKVLMNLKQTTCVFNYFILKTLLLMQDVEPLNISKLENYQQMFINDGILNNGIRHYSNHIARNIQNYNKKNIKKYKITSKKSNIINNIIVNYTLNCMKMSLITTNI